jgi:hypothetical protein
MKSCLLNGSEYFLAWQKKIKSQLICDGVITHDKNGEVWSSDLSTINKYRAILLRNICYSCLATVKLSDTPLEMMTKLNQTNGFGHQNALQLKRRLKEIYFPPTRDPVTIFHVDFSVFDNIYWEKTSSIFILVISDNE